MRASMPARVHEIYDEDVLASVLVYVKWKDGSTVRHASEEVFLTKAEVLDSEKSLRALLTDKAFSAANSLCHHYRIAYDAS